MTALVEYLTGGIRLARGDVRFGRLASPATGPTIALAARPLHAINTSRKSVQRQILTFLEGGRGSSSSLPGLVPLAPPSDSGSLDRAQPPYRLLQTRKGQ